MIQRKGFYSSAHVYEQFNPDGKRAWYAYRVHVSNLNQFLYLAKTRCIACQFLLTDKGELTCVSLGSSTFQKTSWIVWMENGSFFSLGEYVVEHMFPQALLTVPDVDPLGREG